MDTIVSKEEFTRRRNAEASEEEKVKNKDVNTADTAKVVFETEGRFSLPKELYFYNYKGKDINDLTLTRDDELLNTITSVLNRNLHETNKDYDMKDATPEELLEILFNLYAQSCSPEFTFYWICDCQHDEKDKNKKVNENIIHVSDLHFTNITETDKKLREFYLRSIKEAKDPDAMFKLFLERKYKKEIKNTKDYNLEKELESIQVKEPFLVFDNNGKDVFEFQFPRIRHIIDAHKYVENKYYGKIKQLQNKKEANVPLLELQKRKEEQMKELEYQKGKDLIVYAKAFSILKKNGKELTNEEKILEAENISGQISVDLNYTLDSIKFGLDDKKELVCPECGETSERVLRREFDIRYILPINNSSKGIKGKSTSLNIFIGA